MKSPFDPFAAMRLSLELARMTAEAQQVITMRLLGMAGAWNVTPQENTRMVAEKHAAARDAAKAAGRALRAGATPQGVALAALKPVRRRTRANAARLAGRGPATGV